MTLSDPRKMFIHAYDGYMRHAFPHDELKPLSGALHSISYAGSPTQYAAGSWTDSLAELGNLNMKNLPEK